MEGAKVGVGRFSRWFHRWLGILGDSLSDFRLFVHLYFSHFPPQDGHSSSAIVISRTFIFGDFYKGFSWIG